jgi:protein-tyrosine kinase
LSALKCKNQGDSIALPFAEISCVEELTCMNHIENSRASAFATLAEGIRIFSALQHALEASSNCPCIGITSALPGEGKTLLASGLALTAVKQPVGRVLVIDLNWYRPALHTAFGLEQTVALTATTDARTAIAQARSPGVAGLEVLAAPLSSLGVEAPGLNVLHLGLDLIRTAQATYDLVIVDLPSVFPTNRRMMDPVVLSRSLDGVVWVVLTNVTPKQTAKRAYLTLTGSGSRVLGAVVNQWKNALI